MTNNPKSLISKPEWLRVKAPQVERIGNTANLLNDLKLNTVCQEARRQRQMCIRDSLQIF